VLALCQGKRNSIPEQHQETGTTARYKHNHRNSSRYYKFPLVILQKMSKGENIVKWIEGQKITWLGHLERMEEDRMPKNIFTKEMEGTRRRGRPRKGWKEDLERDLQVLGVRRGRELMTERTKWRDTV